MSKRLTDTQKWADPWFGELDPLDKLFWIYLLDNCDHAGIWKVHMALAEFHLGFKPSLAPFKSKLIKINNEKIFIPKFIEFQYGKLREDNRVHRSAMDRLKELGAYKALNTPLQGCKDKDIDKDKDKHISMDHGISMDHAIGMDRNKSKHKDKYDVNFEILWDAGLPKRGKGRAYKAYKSARARDMPSVSVCAALIARLVEHKRRCKKSGRFCPSLPHLSTWINDSRWDDEIEDQKKVEYKAGPVLPFCEDE